jgi:virginiamycin B lyase
MLTPTSTADGEQAAPTLTSAEPGDEPTQGDASRPLGQLIEFAVPSSHPHDVAPAPDGTVWYTGQRSGEMGRLDPATGETRVIQLPGSSSPHGVIVAADGAAWITDGGANAIVRIDGTTEAITSYPLPANRPNTNLNTAAIDRNGVVWFTGQNGIYGSLDPATGAMNVYDAPRGRGLYGITATPNGDIYYASLAGSYVGQVNIDTGEVIVLDPPTPGQGARRVWSDSRGRIWVAEWNVGQLALYDPADGSWREWKLPGASPLAYAVYVDEKDMVWVTDFGGNALVRFDPQTEAFEVFAYPSPDAQVRQLLGRPGEIWGAESSQDKLVVLYTE